VLSNTHLLQRFLGVVDCGTLHAAAEAIGVTQPALTRSLKLLEESVGEALFERRGRGLTLTPLGVLLAEQARHLLREQQLAEAELLAFRKGEHGNLRVGAASIWMMELLPKVIARMHESYPLLQVTLSSMNYAEGAAGLQDGTLDAFFGGFQIMEPLPSYLIRRPLFVARLVVIARAGHPIFDLPTADAAALARYRWLSFQSDVAYLDNIREVVREACGQPLHVTAQCDSMSTTLELLRQGDYLAFLPSSFLTRAGGKGLDVVTTELPDVQFNSGPIFRRFLQQNAAFTLLLDTAVREVAEARLPVPGSLPSKGGGRAGQKMD